MPSIPSSHSFQNWPERKRCNDRLPAFWANIWPTMRTGKNSKEKRRESLDQAELETMKAHLQELRDIREINDVWFKWHHACTGRLEWQASGRHGSPRMPVGRRHDRDRGPSPAGQGPKGPKECTEFWSFFYGDEGPLPYVFQCSVSERVTVNGDTAVRGIGPVLRNPVP